MNPEQLKQNHADLVKIMTLHGGGMRSRKLNALRGRFTGFVHPVLDTWLRHESQTNRTSDALLAVALLKHVEEMMIFIVEGTAPLDGHHLYMKMAGLFLEEAERLRNETSHDSLLSTHISGLCHNGDFRLFLHREMNWFKLTKGFSETRFAVLGLCTAEHIHDFNGYGPCVDKWYRLASQFDDWMDNERQNLKQA